MKRYPESVTRRAMKRLEVVLKAIAGQIKWIQAADILGVSPRTIRRIRASCMRYGVTGLLDKRCISPSARKAPYEIVEKVLRLYREEYYDFNVKHFHEHLMREHRLEYSYTWTKNLLQEAGYVKRQKGRGGHRKRRERRALFGQMVHLDGSDHEWLALKPGERQVLLLAVDDATGKNLAGRLVEAETTKECLSVMREVVDLYGIPVQLYTDRDSVYWYTRKAGGKVDRERLTQFGRAMEELGVEMIPGYSPQARGRSERWNGTWQGRLVAELRRAGIDTLDDANRYINEVFLPDMNKRFAVEPAEVGSAFVSAQGADLDRIFALRYEARTVANDNTVRVNNLTLQIEKSPFRDHFVKCQVEVFEHLEGTYTVVWKKRVIGRFDETGNNMLFASGKLGLSLKGQRKKRKKEKRKQHTSAPSPAVSWALGSLPSVALSSHETEII
ncbi:MAG: ISNCY family transposase [Deltaproteobacteria bacterium]|nr:ISNCY family transposase [Deltaproteobacteria bacterium]